MRSSAQTDHLGFSVSLRAVPFLTLVLPCVSDVWLVRLACGAGANAWVNWLQILNLQVHESTGGTCIAPMDSYQRMGLSVIVSIVFFVGERTPRGSIPRSLRRLRSAPLRFRFQPAQLRSRSLCRAAVAVRSARDWLTTVRSLELGR